MSHVKFEELDHTADVGLRIYGATFAELLANAAEGLFSLIGRAEFPAAETETRAFDIDGADAEERLHRWLRALLAEFNRDGFFPVETTMRATNGDGLRGLVRGGKFELGRHEFLSELKGVTHHALRVTEAPGGFEAEVIFDV